MISGRKAPPPAFMAPISVEMPSTSEMMDGQYLLEATEMMTLFSFGI